MADACAVGLACHAKGDGPDHAYGTAGFRAHADGLDHVMYRMGILAALRSKCLGGRAVGLMVTASHNPERDNGVKLVEPMGEMFPLDWEPQATVLANASDDDLGNAIAAICKEFDVSLSAEAVVVVGRDTRTSSAAMAIAACDGVGTMQPSSVRSLGLVTTPQLHYVVRCIETRGGYGAPSTQGYVEKLLAAFEKLASSKTSGECQRYAPQITVDCANGVGSVSMRQMLRSGSASFSSLLSPTLVNLQPTAERGLNDGCGADFVKVKQVAPGGVDLKEGTRMVSFDGDADRIVYFFHDGEVFRLLDGDRIALLLAHAVASWLKEAGIDGLRLGLVQTAYANGASTACATAAVGAENVICAKTGVKHVHHAALVMDIGIYFEANGHGTVLFSDKFVDLCTKASEVEGPAGSAAQRLLMLRDVINEAVGDAVSIMLAVEAVLRLLDWSCAEWLALYSDLPQRQIKVVVADRSIFETTNAERTCTKPDGLQVEIDRLVATFPRGRAFVRPSGTEDVVRVYVEAETLEATLALGQAIVDVTYTLAGGKGDKPVVT